MTYCNTILATAILFLALATGLLTAPGVFATTFGLEPLSGTAVMARRAGILMIGLAGLAYAVRDLPSGATRKTVIQTFAVVFIAFIILGLFDLIRGTAGAGIFVAILPETVFAALFLRLWFKTG